MAIIPSMYNLMQKARWFDDVHASRTSPATANLGSSLGLSERF